MLDDPKQLATEPLHCAIVLLIPSLVIAVHLLIVLAGWNWRKIVNDWGYRLHIGVFAVGLLAFRILIHYDPGHVWDWFFD